MMELKPIATVRSIFKEKFGIPRQPGLCQSASAYLEFCNNDFNREALKDLEGCSHIWIIFFFHDLKKVPDKAKIRPPRLGGNKYVGVFSSRSPYRPNPIGLSLVELESISFSEEKIKVKISNHDLLEGTPVLDIKPYTECDAPQTEISYSWQQTEWENLEVEFTEDAEAAVKGKNKLRKLICDILKNNPAPAYNSKSKKDKIFGMSINDLNVSFKIENKRCIILKISPSNLI